jgi:hypothetical protein
MNIIMQKAHELSDQGIIFPKALYQVLSKFDYSSDEKFKIESLGEGMHIVYQSIWGWWKPRYLCNDNNQNALIVSTEDLKWIFFSQEDINWESLEGLSDDAIYQAKRLDMEFPSFIRNFDNGIAEVSWQLNPDGQYYMDDDGFGMTSDVEIEIYGFVDKELNVLVSFRYVGENWKLLEGMREEAMRILRSDK